MKKHGIISLIVSMGFWAYLSLAGLQYLSDIKKARIEQKYWPMNDRANLIFNLANELHEKFKHCQDFYPAEIQNYLDASDSLYALTARLGEEYKSCEGPFEKLLGPKLYQLLNNKL